MRKLFEELKAWLSARRRRAVEEKSARRECALVMESRRAVQVREFAGELYISLNGMPFLPLEGLGWDVGTALEVSREAYCRYRRETAGGNGRVSD